MMNSRLLCKYMSNIITNHTSYARYISTIKFYNFNNTSTLSAFPRLKPTDNLLGNAHLRFYSKSKDKGKDKKNKKGKVEIRSDQISTLIDYNDYRAQLQSCVDQLKDDFIKHISLRSSSNALESLKINFEGKDYELQELAQIVRKNPKTTILNMTAFPQVIPNVLEAITSSGLNLNPQQDGTTLFIPIPKVTKEHREQLGKNAKLLFLKCRDSIRENHNDAVKKIKKQAGVSEDMVFSVLRQLEAVTDEYHSKSRTILSVKHEELSKG